MSKIKLDREANAIRKLHNVDAYAPIDVFAMALREENASVVFSDLGENISGVFYRNEDSRIIVINSAMTLGRQRFSMAHELYHLHFDSASEAIVCPREINSGNDNEKKADAFAAALLMPSDGLYYEVNRLKKCKVALDISDIIWLEQFYGVSHAAMLFRLKDEGYITDSDYKKFSDKVKTKAAMLDFDTSLYRVTNETKTYGYYIKLARELFNRGAITESKFREILKEGYMEEIADDGIEIGEDTFE